MKVSDIDVLRDVDQQLLGKPEYRSLGMRHVNGL
jgi:hypothetical protein